MPAKISVLAELERVGWRYEWAGDNEVKCCCPFHDDKTPSCGLNVQEGVFKCHAAGCGASGDFVSFLARALRSDRATTLLDLSKRYDLTEEKTVEPDVVERYHSAIWQAKPLLTELYKRGVTDELIRRYRLGEVDGRISIPVRNEHGHWVNIRKYLPGAPTRDKMRNLRGRGRIRLFPLPDQLKYDEVVLCGGEIKAIVAAAELNTHGIGAITATAGEGNWDASLTPAFSGKKVWVLLDVDEGGQTAAQERCAQIKRVASWVGNVLLPLDRDKYPHGDINDWVGQEGKRLLPLLEATPEWEPLTLMTPGDEEPLDVDLKTAIGAQNAGRRLRVRAVVSAMDTAPYIVPKDVTVKCSRDQHECGACPVFTHARDSFTLHPESPVILEMVNATRGVQREALMRGLGMPMTCKVVDFQADTYYNVEDTRVSPQLEITNRAAERVMQPAVCIGPGIDLNETYLLTGRTFPHPRTQQSTLLVSSYAPTQDALSTYKCDSLDTLTVFEPTSWTIDGLQSKLDEVYADLEANVTRIYDRREMHVAVDLAYHSPLLLPFDGRTVKGWVEVLVLGDSSQGKSETTMNLLRHYGLGEKVECKNASVAGLLGGLQQMGNRWFVTWGVIPTHDRRLVVLEELKGANTEVIAKLTDMRSSGIAEIPKIEKRRTHARTRIIALSNPRSDQQLSSYSFGIEAIKELVGGLEDIRRFDLAVLLSASDIDAARLNLLQTSRPCVEHRFTGELCRRLVLWAWTRETEQVTFEREAQASILTSATAVCDEFTEAIPLADRGSMRLKLARLSASLAARTFSHGDDSLERLVVRACHVEYVVRFMRAVYSSRAFGYDSFTQALRVTRTLLRPTEVQQRLQDTPYPRDLCKQLLYVDHVELQDLQDWCGWDRLEASRLLSLLVRNHALVRDGRHYRKTPPFIQLIRDTLANGTLADRPDFIPDTEF